MSIKILLKKKGEVVAKMRAFLEGASAEDRAMTEEESASYKELAAEKVALEGQIEMVQSSGIENEDPEVTPVATAKPTKAINHLGGPRAKKDFESLDEFVATIAANENDPRLAEHYTRYQSEQRMDTGSAGGFMVPTQFRAEMLSTDPAQALVRPRARVIPAGSPPDAEIQIPMLEQRVDADGSPRVFGGVEVAKVSEGGTKPVTDAKLRMLSLKPHEIAARIPFTDKLLRNWGAASGWAAQLLRGAMNAFEDYQFLQGNGVGGPSGILLSSGAVAVNRAVSSQVAFADIKAMFARFLGMSGVWVASPAAFEYLLGVTGDGGGATNIIKVDQSTGQVTMYGFPLIRHPRMPALGVKGDLALIDFSEYLIKDGSGPIIEVGYATGQWETNKRSIKITWNVDGKPWRDTPFEEEDQYERSGVVVLDVPAGS